MIYPGKEVKIFRDSGVSGQGVVLELCDFGGVDLWWVQVEGDCLIFEEDKLIAWNPSRKCICGAVAASAPNAPTGHANYCDALK